QIAPLQPPPEAASAAPLADQPAVAVVNTERLIVQITAVRRSWVSAIVDGRRAVQREFQPGEEQTFEVHKEIVLTTGDTGGVAVTFNGLPAKPLGASGQVATTRVNLTNF